MKREDKKAEALGRLQKELDRRTQAERQAVQLITDGEYKKACELLDAMDEDPIRAMEAELDGQEKDVEGVVKDACEQAGRLIGDFLLGLMEDVLTDADCRKDSFRS